MSKRIPKEILDKILKREQRKVFNSKGYQEAAWKFYLKYKEVIEEFILRGIIKDGLTSWDPKSLISNMKYLTK